MGSDVSKLDEARKAWGQLQSYTTEYMDGIDAAVQKVRDKLALAEADASALDPEGRKSRAEMEAAIDAAARDGYLRTARKRWTAFQTYSSDSESMITYAVEQIMKALEKSGRGLEGLDGQGVKSGSEMAKEFAAAKKRAYLNGAREKLADFETTDVPYGLSSCDYIRKTIRELAAKSGQGLGGLLKEAELPPLRRLLFRVRPSLREKAVEERLGRAYRRVCLISARKEYADLMQGSSAYADSGDYWCGKIMKMLSVAGAAKEALDPEGKKTAGEIDSSFADAIRRCNVDAAQRAVRDFIDGFGGGETDSTVYRMNKIRKHLEKAQCTLADLGLPASYAPDTVMKRFGEVERRVELKEAMKALEAFENPRKAFTALSDISGMSEDIAGQFNRAAAQLALENPDNPDIRREIGERIIKAADRAREVYYANGGKVPVMKTLRFRAS